MRKRLLLITAVVALVAVMTVAMVGCVASTNVKDIDAVSDKIKSAKSITYTYSFTTSLAGAESTVETKVLASETATHVVSIGTERYTELAGEYYDTYSYSSISKKWSFIASTPKSDLVSIVDSALGNIDLSLLKSEFYEYSKASKAFVLKSKEALSGQMEAFRNDAASVTLTVKGNDAVVEASINIIGIKASMKIAYEKINATSVPRPELPKKA